LDGVLAAGAAWGEDPGAFLFDEMMYGGIGAVDAGVLLNSPIAQVGCVNGLCMVGSYSFATPNGDGTFSVNWQAQYQAEIQHSIDQINQAFEAMAKAQNLYPDQEITVQVQFKNGVWAVTCADQACLSAIPFQNGSSWSDPIGWFHHGDSSWYAGPWYDSFGFDVAYVVESDPATAHTDPFGPFNPLHYLLQLPAMLGSPGPLGTIQCSISGGCQ
jgi:hypothetical protein